jgi:hypothetical protein
MDEVTPPEPPAFEITAPPLAVEIPGERELWVAMHPRRHAWFLELEDYAIELDAWSLRTAREAQAWEAAYDRERAEHALTGAERDYLTVENKQLQRQLDHAKVGGLTIGVAGVITGLTLGFLISR